MSFLRPRTCTPSLFSTTLQHSGPSESANARGILRLDPTVPPPILSRSHTHTHTIGRANQTLESFGAFDGAHGACFVVLQAPPLAPQHENKQPKTTQLCVTHGAMAEPNSFHSFALARATEGREPPEKGYCTTGMHRQRRLKSLCHVIFFLPFERDGLWKLIYPNRPREVQSSTNLLLPGFSSQVFSLAILRIPFTLAVLMTGDPAHMLKAFDSVFAGIGKYAATGGPPLVRHSRGKQAPESCWRRDAPLILATQAVARSTRSPRVAKPRLPHMAARELDFCLRLASATPCYEVRGRQTSGPDHSTSPSGIEGNVCPSKLSWSVPRFPVLFFATLPKPIDRR